MRPEIASGKQRRTRSRWTAGPRFPSRLGPNRLRFPLPFPRLLFPLKPVLLLLQPLPFLRDPGPSLEQGRTLHLISAANRRAQAVGIGVLPAEFADGREHLADGFIVDPQTAQRLAPPHNRGPQLFFLALKEPFLRGVLPFRLIALLAGLTQCPFQFLRRTGRFPFLPRRLQRRFQRVAMAVQIAPPRVPPSLILRQSPAPVPVIHVMLREFRVAGDRFQHLQQVALLAARPLRFLSGGRQAAFQIVQTGALSNQTFASLRQISVRLGQPCPRRLQLPLLADRLVVLQHVQLGPRR